MKIIVRPMEFDIFSLFCDDWPYGLIVAENELCERLNAALSELYLTAYQELKFQSMDDCGLDRWKIHIVKYGEKSTRPDAYYPKDRVYTITQAKKGIPAPIRRALEKLNDLTFIFSHEDD